MAVPVRPLRADAARNRTRILDAARAAFAEAGLDVGVEEIARRAGVGKGTLYRRFPTKEALVRAIFEDILDEVERFVAASEAEPDAWEAFAGYLRASARMQASNQGFFDVVAQRLGAAALTPEQRTRILSAAARPLRRAQEAGAVRDDLVPEDVQLMLRMVGATTRPAPDGSPMDEHWPRFLGLLLDAVRPGAATPLPAAPWRLG
jgi:AcrR family transcriptional regulator